MTLYVARQVWPNLHYIDISYAWIELEKLHWFLPTYCCLVYLNKVNDETINNAGLFIYPWLTFSASIQHLILVCLLSPVTRYSRETFVCAMQVNRPYVITIKPCQFVVLNVITDQMYVLSSFWWNIDRSVRISYLSSISCFSNLIALCCDYKSRYFSTSAYWPSDQNL